ncbi:transmembrane protein 150A-like [Sinocyclocheilus grahami]|uniref:transmembrane protein 150A-like n=1 Tax=Sinocyclocheilus grahami TaxID=75366 RepID=UPI0007AD69A1|nr:PREDICTED: transmembrane protein 150A-like [Sinocyclocheilus grahami]
MIQRSSSGRGKMSLWFLLPISLPVFTLPGIWIIIDFIPVKQSHTFSSDDCNNETIDRCLWVTVTVIVLFVCYSDCDHSVLCITVIVIGLLRYAQLIHKHSNSVLNIEGLFAGWLCAAGLMIVGNFQVDHAKVLHYVGAGLAFPGSLLFVCVQTLLSYRAAETQRDFQTAHLRLTLTALAFTTLILSGVFFIQESFVLQHAAAILEWMFAIIVLLFYSSFSLEFGSISSETLTALMTRRAGASEDRHRLEKV